MFLSPTEFMQQQAEVLRNQALHAARNQIDTTAVLNTLEFFIPKFPAESVVSNALTDALMAIERDIEAHMGGH